MTLTIESDLATAVQVTPDVTWHPHHTWDHTSSHVDGYLTADNTARVELDVTLARDSDIAAYRGTATHLWLRGHLLAVSAGPETDPTPLALVIPVDRLTADAVREAVYRYRCGLYTHLHLDD